MSSGSVDTFLVKFLDAFLVIALLFKPCQSYVDTFQWVADGLPPLANYLCTFLVAHVWILGLDVRRWLSFVDTVWTNFLVGTPFCHVTFQQQFLPLLLKTFLLCQHFLAASLVLVKHETHLLVLVWLLLSVASTSRRLIWHLKISDLLLDWRELAFF